MDFNRTVDISTLPQVNIGRSVFDLSHDHYTTFNVGELVPVLCMDCLPGETWKIGTDFLARLQTLLTPMMGHIYLDQYYFFVPNRLLWSHWEEFLGANKTGYWTNNSVYTEPLAFSEFATNLHAVPAKSIADHIGIPTGINLDSETVPSALPFRAVAMIWNEYFRDENLQDPLVVSTGDTAVVVPSSTDLTTKANFLSYAQTGLTALPKVAKYHDLFTSCLPSPLKGPQATINLSGVVPVKSFANAFTAESLKNSDGKYYPVIMDSITGASATTKSGISSSQNVGVNSSGQLSRENGDSTMGSSTYHPIFTNLGVNIGEATMATINDLRMAFATQRYYEALARSGSRYTELLRGLFSVETGDARLQRPEYLGGSHSVLNVEQIVQTSESTSNSPLGETGAYSLSWDSDDIAVFSTQEHGWLIGFVCARISHDYQQGIAKRFTRRSKFDYYFPQFANIGEQPVKTKEIFVNAAGSGDNTRVFGYQEAWYEYRYGSGSSNVTGEMRSNYANSLDVWHLADDYSSRPTLSDDWIVEDKSNVDRVLTVQSSVSDQILLNLHFNLTATRPLPAYSIPGGLDLR